MSDKPAVVSNSTAVPNRQFTVADRTYEVLNVHAGKNRIDAHEMLKQGRFLKANMSDEDAAFIIHNTSVESIGFKEDDSIAFLDWRPHDSRDYAFFYTYTGKNGWQSGWAKMSSPFGLLASVYLIRRIS